MEPIISPWLIYWINLFGNFQVLFVFSIIILVAGSVVSLICWKSAYYEKNAVDGEMWFKRCLSLLLIIIPITCFTPSKATLIQMVVAKNITYERVDKALVAGKEIKNELKKDVIDILTSIKDDDKGGKR